MNKLVSIIIPIYKVEKFLSRCIDSVLNQTYTCIEIILVDDGSPDNCPQICDDYAKKDERIKVIHQKNGGLSVARNSGLKICKGEYIFFIDSDDWLVDEYVLNDFVEKAEKEQSDFVYSLFNTTDSKKESKPFINKRYIKDNDLFFLSNPYLFSAWNKLYSYKLFQQFKFEPGRVNEDVDIIPLIFLTAKKISRINRPTYNYFCNQNSITRSSFSEKRFDMFKSVRNVYEKFNGTEKQSIIFFENIFGFQLFSVYIEILKIRSFSERSKYLNEFIELIEKNQFLEFYKYSLQCFLHNETIIKKIKKISALLYLQLYALFRGKK